MVPKEYMVPVGAWLVEFQPIYNDEDRIEEVHAVVRKVDCNDIHLHRVELSEPCKVEYDDTHDLSFKVFRTLKDARRHRNWTLNRFNRPQPWESFVKVA